MLMLFRTTKRLASSRKLEAPGNQLLKHKVGIILLLHVLELLHIRRAVMCNDILVVTGIVHELIWQIAPVRACDMLDLRMHVARGIVRRLVTVGEPMTRIEYKPGLVDALQAQWVAAASFARENGTGGYRLQAQGQGSGGHRLQRLQLRRGRQDRFYLLVGRGGGLEARGEPVPSTGH